MTSEAEIEAEIVAIADEIAKVQRGEATATESALKYLEGAVHAFEAVIGRAGVPDAVQFTRVA